MLWLARLIRRLLGCNTNTKEPSDGVFFTNVLVRTSPLALDAVAVAVGRALDADGWESLSDPTDAPTRRVLLVPEEGWVAVYDEGTGGQDFEVLERIASDLSAFLDSTVVSTLVNDSDYLAMQVFDQGNSIGFIECGVEGVNVNEGGFDPWRQLFPHLKHVVATDALERKHVFIEENLRELATAIGLPVQAASTGFRYSFPDFASRPGARTFCFVPSALEASTTPNVAVVHAKDMSGLLDGVVEWHATFRNHGSGFRGLNVTIHQAEGLVSLERVRVTAGARFFGTEEPIVEERALGSPQSLANPLSLDFHDVALPAGAPLDHLRKLKLCGNVLDDWARVAMPTLITIDLRLVPTARGEGRLILSATPLHRVGSAHHDVACVIT